MEWRDVPGFPGYQVSRRGIVRTSTGYRPSRVGLRYVLHRDGQKVSMPAKEIAALAWPQPGAETPAAVVTPECMPEVSTPPAPVTPVAKPEAHTPAPRMTPARKTQKPTAVSSVKGGKVAERKSWRLGQKPGRRCHDCGRPTPDYRCAECWRKIRGSVWDDDGGWA